MRSAQANSPTAPLIVVWPTFVHGGVGQDWELCPALGDATPSRVGRRQRANLRLSPRHPPSAARGSNVARSFSHSAADYHNRDSALRCRLGRVVCLGAVIILLVGVGEGGLVAVGAVDDAGHVVPGGAVTLGAAPSICSFSGSKGASGKDEESTGLRATVGSTILEASKAGVCHAPWPAP